MKYTINKIAWIGLFLSILAALGTSCKKDNDVAPAQTTTNTYSSTKYVIEGTKQQDEADTIWIINNNNTLTSSCLITCSNHDTINLIPNGTNLYRFSHQMRAFPLILSGDISINGSVLILNCKEWNTINNTWNHAGIVNKKYNLKI